MTRSRGLLVLIVLAGVLVRLGWGARQPRDDAGLAALPDQAEYLQLGRHLRAGQGPWLYDARFDAVALAYRTPGYPLFVALCGADVRIVRIAQALLDGGTVLSAYALARRWLPARRSLVAAGLVAANPFLIYFAGLILTETLFVALLTGGTALLAGRRGRLAAGAGGAMLAASVLVRPAALALPALAGAACGWLNRPPGRSPWSACARPAILLALATLLALFPWALRNKRRLGAWVWTATDAGVTRYDGFNPAATGASDQRFVARLPQLRSMDEVSRDRWLAREADAWAAAHPLRAAELAAVKVGRTWSPVPLSEQYGRRAYVAAALAYSLPLDALAVAGLLMRRRLPAGAKALLVLPAAYFTLACSASVGSLRYRVPAEPMLAVIAASALGRTSPEDGERRVGRPETARPAPV